MRDGRRMIVTHCQTAVLRFEDVHTCTCRQIDIPLVGNTGRRAKCRDWVESTFNTKLAGGVP